MTDLLELAIVIGAAVLAFFSFVNNLAMRAAIVHLKKRADRMFDRIEKAMDDPTGTLVPHVEKMIQRLNDDKEFRVHLGGAVTWFVTTAKTAVMSGRTADEKPGPNGEPPKKKKGGILSMLAKGAEVAEALGFKF